MEKQDQIKLPNYLEKVEMPWQEYKKMSAADRQIKNLKKKYQQANKDRYHNYEYT